MLSLSGLFLAALIAATLLPAQSEAVLVALLLDGGDPVLLIAVATAGNVLGSLVNWWLGLQVQRFQGRRGWSARRRGIDVTGAGRCCCRGLR